MEKYSLARGHYYWLWGFFISFGSVQCVVAACWATCAECTPRAEALGVAPMDGIFDRRDDSMRLQRILGVLY